MKYINSETQDHLKKFIDEVTVTDVTPEGVRVKSLQSQRSHRGMDWTNIVVRFHESDTRDLMNRKELVVPMMDKGISMAEDGTDEEAKDRGLHLIKLAISGALHKAGFFNEYEARPEVDKYLY